MERLTRRSFLRDLGGGVVGVVIFGIAACGDEATPTTAPASPTTAAGATPTTAVEPTITAAPGTTQGLTTTTGAAAVGGWSRVRLSPASAYIVVRGTRAALVDTGLAGSAPAIEEVLAELGISWGDVGDVILTHRHGDHVGGLGEVMAAAPDAVGYAGAADIEAIDSPRQLVAVGDGDLVFELEIVATPGHTPGHVSVYDSAARTLVAGDALNGSDGGVAGPNPQFSSDMELANASARRLAELDFDVLLFGHGEPVTSGAAEALRRLVAES